MPNSKSQKIIKVKASPSPSANHSLDKVNRERETHNSFISFQIWDKERERLRESQREKEREIPVRRRRWASATRTGLISDAMKGDDVRWATATGTGLISDAMKGDDVRWATATGTGLIFDAMRGDDVMKGDDAMRTDLWSLDCRLRLDRSNF